ncbi:hypothetical protein DFH11DRAFT_1541988 [Phellopilus nigrolimitatus]|nr:hypothetical protein DFH11DRAFT_1550884 [Phellopilus nigrolimitatus]KAH8116784.1 hypothetical protein DFH11DRAFT_1541988 [Phellopilus nigrolimitatus]
MHTGGPRKILQHLRLLQINNRHSQLPPPKPRKILQHRRLLQINNRRSQLPPPKPRKILQLLRLLQINKPTFPPPKPCKILQLLRLLQINKHLFLRILSLHSERNECANDGFRFTGMAAWQSLHLRATRQSLHLRDAVSRRSRVGKSRAATETINGCEERLLACGRRNGIAGGQGKCMTSSQGWRSIFQASKSPQQGQKSGGNERSGAKVVPAIFRTLEGVSVARARGICPSPPPRVTASTAPPAFRKTLKTLSNAGGPRMLPVRVAEAHKQK